MRLISSMPAPFVYLAVDCWRWLLVIAAGLIVRRWLRRRPDRLSHAAAWWHATDAPRKIAMGLGGLAVAAALVSTPNLRFTAALHGDEPKYIRFCESFCQGLGFDLVPIRQFGDLPKPHVPQISGAVRAAVTSVRTELRFLRRDTRDALAGRTRFNRATYTGAWFLRGKDSGVYQVHNPGLSFALLPGYALDHYLSTGASGDGKFPNSLRFTTITLLAIYALWTAVLFDTYVRFGSARGLAAVLTMTAMLTIPVAALPFQIYPETAAGLLLLVVVRHTLLAPIPSPAGALAAGLAAAGLPWLHVRFLAVSALWTMAAVVRHRRRPRAAAAFVGTYAFGLVLLSFYTYHVTGSLLPTATYYANQSPEPFAAHSVVPGVLGQLFDRDYGLFPYSPVYLLALPGIIPFFVKRPFAAVLIGCTIVELAVLSAGHSWNSAGGSPLRHLAAVMPLALVPIGAAAERYRSSRGFWVVAALLLTFSLQNAFAYNLHHYKDVGPMADASTSGWKTLLLFPLVFAVEPATRQTFQLTPLLGAWIGIALLLFVLPMWSGRARTPSPAQRPWPLEVCIVAGLLALALIGLGVGTVTDTLSAPQYAAGP